MHLRIGLGSHWRAAMVAAGLGALAACAPINVQVFPDASEPLREFTLQGRAREKILLLSVSGFISDAPSDRLFYDQPSVVQEVVAQLHRAAADRNIRAIVLKMDSPGGSSTGSDILYHELLSFRQRTGIPIVVAMMNVAASGGYMASLPADRIVAHPTTVTGSVGVVFMRPQFSGLMGKIGIEMEVSKSGPQKDMGSPFRRATPEEDRLFQELVDGLNRRFLEMVARHRPQMTQEQLAEVATARVYLAEDAVRVGLIDQVGYLDDALAAAVELAGLPAHARVVAYRRTEFADDNLYNPALSAGGSQQLRLLDLGRVGDLANLRPGFYFLWAPEF